MSKYFTDYSSVTVGNQPPNTTLRRSAAAGDYTRQDDSSVAVLRYLDTTGGSVARALSYDSISSSGVTEIFFEAKDANLSAPSSCRFVAFASDGPDTEYGVILQAADDSLIVYKRVSGTFTEIKRATKTLNATDYFNVRFRITPGSPNQLQARLWNAGASEPVGVWDIDVPDTQSLSSGWIGHVGFSENQTVFFKRIGIGTNDDPAPTSAADVITTIRKSSQFTVEETLAGNVVSATLNGNSITVDSHVGTTVTLTDTGSGITTSGEYPLVLTDDSATPQTETITVQVNVYGVVPSNNPWQKDGSALASLSNVQYRVVAGADLNGTGLFYTATGATDASGNIPTFDVSDTAAADADVVHIVGLTANGESIVAPETVELI